MFSRFHGNRLLDVSFNRAYMCPPDDDKKNDDDKAKADKDKADKEKEFNDLKTSNADLMARLAKLEGRKPDDDKKNDDDLNDKAKKERQAKDKRSADAKQIEAALKFSLGSKEWLKNNAALLPAEMGDIFAAAEKETYDSAVDKDAAIKSGVIKSFFSVQSNLDLLTASQKSAIEEFLKLTNNGRVEKAQVLYDQIFEPAFEMLKRVKKAEELGKSGLSTGTDAEDAYKKRLMDGSKKHYLGEKH